MILLCGIKHLLNRLFKITDENLKQHIESANNNFDELVDIYKGYVSKSETEKERLKRINLFRCRGL